MPAEALEDLYETALLEQGFEIYGISGYRSYDRQYEIYATNLINKGTRHTNLYSASPGNSEHQTGLATDINTANSSDHFENTKEYEWLQNNAYKYGFIIRYPLGKEDITEYIYEPWHLRYVGIDLATKLYNDGNWITLEEYFGIDSKYR